MLAICAIATAAPALAQSAGTTTSPAADATQGDASRDSAAESSGGSGEEIIVTGLRQSLANSQNLKRNADTVVDAITAEDIGALPDRSVTEALQRVPGVAINRFAGSSDPDHFSVEGSGVVIRGLNFVRSEFNGRDSFSANAGRSLGFSDVPSELLGSVIVAKNTTAEMIEGGLAGTVNLNTRVPFDNKGFHVGFSLEANYGDFSKKTTPVVSLLVSNTWDTGIGTIGLLGSISYSQLKSRADGMQVSNIQTRDGATVIAANSTTTTTVRNQLPTDAGGTSVLPLAYAPIGASYRTQDYDRERQGIAFAAQWESLDRRALVTAQYLRSESSSAWNEHTFEAAGDLAEYNTFPYGCREGGTANCPAGFQNYQYDENGVFESGYITLPGTGWRSADSGGTWRTPSGGMQHSLSNRAVDDDNTVEDWGLNIKFDPSDRWSINLDGQYTRATHDNLDVSIFGSVFADSELDLTGKVPQGVAHKPLHLAAEWAAPVGQTPNTRINGENDQQYFADPGNYFWRAAMDHFEQSTGHEAAFKADVAYNFADDSFLRRFKFGARWSDRDQTVRSTTYNWGAISEVWSGSAVWMDQGPGVPYVQHYDFDNFFRGAANAPPGGFYLSLNPVDQYAFTSQLAKSINDYWHNENGATATNRWVPVAERAGLVPGTPFLPGEIQVVSEETKAAYAMLSFGNNEPIFGGITLDGNIGLRFVDSKVDSAGAVQFPLASATGNGQPRSEVCDVTPVDPDGEGPLPPVVPDLPAICDLTPEAFLAAQAFTNGGSLSQTATNKFHHFLPSLNLKFGLTDQLILRFAASRVLARPEMSYVRNFINVGTDTAAGFRFQATAGNPYIKPATANTFDLGLEWYFAKVGSLTAAAFYKKVHGFFYQNVFQREFTNNGSTQQVFIRGPDNYDGDGTVKGFELSYQQTYDFLPGFLSGLGVNANYTYIDSKGLPNTFLNTGVPTNTPPTGRGTLPLEGLSKHNFNLTVFYEKGPISLRGAYSWRSKFLETATDVIFPYFPIYNDATGQLDASLFVSVTKEIKLGVQAVNLLNETTKTLQQFTPDGLLGPRSYFVNDRRFSFLIRGNF